MGQFRYEKPDGSIVNYGESAPGSGVGDVADVPSSGSFSRKGVRNQLPYTREGVRGLNTSQFGLDKQFDPNFKLSVDFRPVGTPIPDLQRRGQSLFGNYQTSESERPSIPFGQGFIYATESGLHGPYEGPAYYEASLATMEQQLIGSVSGAVSGYWTANIETSNEWWPGDQGNVLPGFSTGGTYNIGGRGGSWSAAQSRTIQLEATQETITLGQLASRGQAAWENEMRTRRTNRVVLMMVIAKNNTPPGGKCAYGASMYQGQPKTGNAFQTGSFQEGNCNVSNIGGNSNGNITLNGRNYTLSGDIYSQETFHLDYYYQFQFNMAQVDYQAIFVNQESDKTNYPYIWGKITPRHVVADQIGHFQANKYRMQNRGGIQNRPVIVMRELPYEADVAGYVNGQALIARVPSNMNAGYIDFQDGGSTNDDLPKIWIPPYEQYSYYICARWALADRAGSGFHLWNAPGQINLSNQLGYNHEYHAVTAVFQARHDMQPFEQFIGQMTTIETPDVQANQSGAYESYTAVAAYNFNDGSFGPQRPVYQAKYLAQASGFIVLVLGGMGQAHDAERTDNVRVNLPGMSGAVTLAMKLRGPAAQVAQFFVPSSDSGQTFFAQFTTPTDWTKPGYAGRINQ